MATPMIDPEAPGGLPATMTAAVLTCHGGPEALEVRDDVAVPEPGAGEVLVAVAAAGVNNTDIWSRQGAYGTAEDADAVAGWRGEPLVFPRIQGGDVAGRIAAVGAGVVGERVGARVLIDPAGYDRDEPDAHPVALLGSERDGGFADFVVVDDERAHDVGASPLSDEQLAALPIAHGTALGMLARGQAAPGETVLVTGASGGVGLALVELAAARGARVVAVTSAATRAAVYDAGAAEVVTRGEGDITEAVARAAGGPIDLFADVVGGVQLTRLAGLLAEGGRVVVAGAVAGPVVTLDLRVWYLHQRRLIGSSMHTPAHFVELAGLAAAGRVAPRVAGVWPLERIAEAQRDFAAKGFAGKLVLIPPAARQRAGDAPAEASR